jgi:hypothetical protein
MARRSKSVGILIGNCVGVLAIVCVLATPRNVSAQDAHHTRSVARTAVADAPALPVITLERTACHGQCAEYKLSFYEDGQVIYDGMANVSKAGRWYARVPRSTVEDLTGDFRRIGYDTLAAKYPPGIADSPVATVSLRESGRMRTVTHQQNSPFPPPALSVLEDRLDAAVQSVDWVK